MNSICLVGDVLIDVTLKNKNEHLKMRLGGIIHSSRALWALSSSHSIGCISPKYLDSRIIDYLSHYNNPNIIKIANVSNSPNVILIEEAREIGDQGYELLLRDDIEFEHLDFDFPECDSILITSGQYDICRVLSQARSIPVSIEVANMSYRDFCDLNFKFKNVYISTSSKIFVEYTTNYPFDFEKFVLLFEEKCEMLILKENRGGTRLYNFSEKRVYQCSSQTQPIVHSVGVGDVFNAVFESSVSSSIEYNLALSSHIAGEYATTTFPVNFKSAVTQLLKVSIEDLINLKGIVLNWEKRKQINIYIAAPDFSFVDTSLIDKLEKCLKYHNFSPRRPVKENGQMSYNDSPQVKQNFYNADMKLLEECSIVIGVLLNNDPGTLVEIGIASERQMPVLLYDPFNQATNCMLVHSCSLVSSNLDDIICETFIKGAKLCLN